MAISFVNKGTFQSGTGTVSPGIPASMADGDLMILIVHSVNESITGPTGWTAAPAFPNHSGTAERGTGAAAGGVRVRCFARWWQSGDSAPTVADTGNMTAAIILGFRGVDSTDPFDSATPVGINAAAATTHTLTGITTNSANAMVVHATALDNDAASSSVLGAPTNANLTSLTEQHDQTVTAGQGGGINAITGFLASAGASGNTTTATGTSTAIASICFALKPYVEPPTDYIGDGWTHRCPIVIQQSVITGSSTLTDMPVLLTHDCIPDDFLDSDLFQSDGGDIRFSSDEDGTAGLALEIVTFSGNATPASATAEIWVKVPSVSNSSDTTIYMFRKTGSGETQVAVTNSKGRNAVWSGNGIKRVYHGNGTTDSTGNGGTLSASGNATTTTTNAKIGSAFTFDGTGDWYTGDSGSDIDNLSPVTMMAWARPVSVAAGETWFLSKGSFDGINLGRTAAKLWWLRGDGAEETTSNVFAANTWLHTTFTATGTTTASSILYANGAAAAQTFVQEGGAPSDASGSFTIGADSGAWAGLPWNGLVDEVWLASTAFSADLIQAIYANQNSPSTFAVEGTITDLGGSSDVTLTPGAGTLTITHLAATVTAASSVAPGAGSLTLTGQAATFAAHWSGTPAQQALILSGLQPSITATAELTPDAGTLTITGQEVIFAADWSAVIGAQALALTGLQAAVSANSEMSPGASSLALTGLAVTFAGHLTAEPGAGSLAITGQAAVITASSSMSPGTAALLLSGMQPSITADSSLTPAVASLTLTGFAPIASGSADHVALPGAGSLTLTGFAVTLSLSGSASPGIGELIISGQAVTWSDGGGPPGPVANYDLILGDYLSLKNALQWRENSRSTVSEDVL